MHLELGQSRAPVDDDRVLAAERGIVEHDGLDLAREDVDAADDQHVVDAAAEARDPPMRAPARARPVDEARDVAGPVAQDGKRLLRQRRQDELAALSGRDGSARLRIDDLGEEVVVEDVQRALRLAALGGDAGADHLREAVDVAGVDAPGRARASSRIASDHGSAPKIP